jgi:GNAT superfamily N-acetyltransferase
VSGHRAATVRDATYADSPAIASLLAELGYPMEGAALAGRLRRILERGDEMILIAEDAEEGGGPVGMLSLHVFPVLAYAEDLAMIMALVVTERSRGTGVGRALIERAEAIARERRASRLMVTTHVRRADAHAFYERLGFDLTGRRYVKGLR